MARPAWITDLFRSIDTMDAPAFSRFLTEDGAFRYANYPAVVGRGAINGFVQGFFGTLGGVSHEVLDVIEGKDVAVVEGKVTYTRKDGSTLTLPFANILRMRGELVHDYAIYVDASKL